MSVTFVGLLLKIRLVPWLYIHMIFLITGAFQDNRQPYVTFVITYTFFFLLLDVTDIVRNAKSRETEWRDHLDIPRVQLSNYVHIAQLLLQSVQKRPVAGSKHDVLSTHNNSKQHHVTAMFRYHGENSGW